MWDGLNLEKIPKKPKKLNDFIIGLRVRRCRKLRVGAIGQAMCAPKPGLFRKE
jgi:hypothetical protein